MDNKFFGKIILMQKLVAYEDYSLQYILRGIPINPNYREKNPIAMLNILESVLNAE